MAENRTFPEYDQLITHLQGSSADDPTVSKGFFNAIPGNNTIIDAQGVAGRYNLVSSAWVDWKNYVLHETNPQFEPKLSLPNGDPIACHGYISGSWTTIDVETIWTGLMVFVVDATFCVDTKDITQSCNFLFDVDALQASRQISRENLIIFDTSLWIH